MGQGRWRTYAALLGEAGPPDRWADHTIDDAIECLRGFDDHDWAQLIAHVPTASVAWRTRCAETLSETEDDRGLMLLLALLHDDAPEVAEAAADSLASLAQNGASIPLDDDARTALARLVARAGLAAAPAHRLLNP